MISKIIQKMVKLSFSKRCKEQFEVAARKTTAGNAPFADQKRGLFSHFEEF